jgi:cytochrome c peroxidase
MMVLVRGWVASACCVAGIMLGLSACVEEELIDGVFTPAEWKKIESHSPVPMQPASPTNRFADDPGAAALGQKMFFEKRYSGLITIAGPNAEGMVGEEGKYACASCHDPKRWFIDTRAPNELSTGAANITKRNSPSMVNIAYYVWGGWGGAQDQFWKQGANSPESKDLNGDRLAVAHVIYDFYRDDYNAVFGPVTGTLDVALSDTSRFPLRGKPKSSAVEPDGAWEGMTPEDQAIVNTILANVGKAFEAYERRLISRNAPFDQYVARDFEAISTSAKRGLKLFVGKAGCDSCHQTETFSDQKFHNTGVAQTMQDLGRYDDVPRLMNLFNGIGPYSDDPTAGHEKLDGVTWTTDLKGLFRTKSLRQVAETGPYFHNGSIASLEEVVRHYNKGGALEGSYPGAKDAMLVPLNLTEAEIHDIVAFLQTLTGEPVPEPLTIDTSAR